MKPICCAEIASATATWVERGPRHPTEINWVRRTITVHYYWDRYHFPGGGSKLFYAGSSIDAELQVIAKALFGWMADVFELDEEEHAR